MDNSASCKTIGQRTMYICSYDDNIAACTGVHLISESRFNFISLKTLNSQGFIYKTESDCMDASKDAHIKFNTEMIGNL